MEGMKQYTTRQDLFYVCSYVYKEPICWKQLRDKPVLIKTFFILEDAGRANIYAFSKITYSEIMPFDFYVI